MAQTTYFFQECPTCGRHLRIRVEYLGRAMACTHCSRTFTASDRVAKVDSPPLEIPLLERAERLLSLTQAPTFETP